MRIAWSFVLSSKYLFLRGRNGLVRIGLHFFRLVDTLRRSNLGQLQCFLCVAPVANVIEQRVDDWDDKRETGNF